MAKRRPKKATIKKRARPVSRSPKRAGSPAALRAVEAALAGVAHDIRTPLTGIVALAELLAASDLAKRERDWANAIKSGADQRKQLDEIKKRLARWKDEE